MKFMSANRSVRRVYRLREQRESGLIAGTDPLQAERVSRLQGKEADRPDQWMQASRPVSFDEVGSVEGREDASFS